MEWALWILPVFMRTWDGAESAPSTYKNLLRVIEVISVWFSFGLFCCCLFSLNALQWRMECPVGLVPPNRSLISSILSLKVKRSSERQTPSCVLAYCCKCVKTVGKISCAPGLGCCVAEECAPLFQGCKLEEGMRNLDTVFYGIRDFNFTHELLAYVYICFRLSAAV